MKLEDLYLINKEEWLPIIKDKCMKRAKTHIWVGLVPLILLLIIMTTGIIYENSHPWTIEDFVFFLTLFLFALILGWRVLKSHSFLKTINGLGTPEQLLNKFKKFVKDKSIIWTIGQLIFCGWFACYCYFASVDTKLKVMGWILILVSVIVHISRLIRGKYVVGPNDEDITRRLQELIGKE